MCKEIVWLDTLRKSQIQIYESWPDWKRMSIFSESIKEDVVDQAASSVGQVVEKQTELRKICLI